MFHVDYIPAKECKNTESYGMICVKCGKCGRKFQNGVMVDAGGTTSSESEEDE